MGKVITCPNVGCRLTFSNRMQKSRHLKKGECKGRIVPKKSKMLKIETGWKCVDCNTVVKHRENISRHSKLCAGPLGKKQKEYTCSECSKKFDYKSVLDRHVKTHEREVFKCNFCERRFKREDHCKIHEKKCKVVSDNVDFQMSNIEDKAEYFSELAHLIPTEAEKENILNLVNPTTTQEEIEIEETAIFPIESNTSINVEFTDDAIYSDDIAGTSVRINSTPKKSDSYFRKIKERKLFKMNEILSSPRLDVKARKKMLDSLLKSQEEDDEKEFQTVYNEKLIRFFKRQLRWKRYDRNMYDVGQLLIKIFGENIHDQSFQKWFGGLLDIDGTIIKNAIESEKRMISQCGRSMLSKEIRQDVYLFWLENSEVSVQRSNDRHLVKISLSKVRTQISDLLQDDVNISLKMTKRGEKYEANRYVTSKHFREIYVSWKQRRNVSISHGSFYNCKPFYVTSPTEKEKEMCLCSKCLNPHTIYKSIRRAIDIELPKSLSEYLCKTIHCNKENLINSHAVDCIKGSCKHDCQIVNITVDLKDFLDFNSVVNYYVFEKIDTYYFNQKGEKVAYKRTARVDKTAQLEDLLIILQEMAKEYLLHRYYVNNDFVYWKKFLDSSKYFVVWMDYSQNIQFTEKKQVQSAHYSGVQHTLHDIVIISPGNTGNQFVYHLSDDTNHDSVLTFAILDDVINNYPHIINNKVLAIRSDNCQNQYKCCNTFPKMKELAKKHDIDVVWFYGEAGHGRGIVDAMSSFGCKQPLKNAILKNDDWFMNANDMCVFLKEHFKDDESKSYHLIKAEDTAEKRKHDEKASLKIKGSRTFHIISVNPKGDFTTIKYLQDVNIIEKIKDSSVLSEEVDDIEHGELNDEFEETNLNYETIFELVIPGTFIAIRKEGKGVEDFYLAEVLDKNIAADYEEDERGHAVAKGEMYVEVLYLEKQDERKNKVIYKHAKDSRSAYIGMGVIFATNIEISDDLKMDMHEYSAILRES